VSAAGDGDADPEADQDCAVDGLKPADGFPREKWIGDFDFDFDAQPERQPRHHPSARRRRWLRDGHPLCLIG
jgi:hypothetical protein